MALLVTAGFDQAPDWDRVDKDEATAALQALVTLVPEHRIAQAIDLFTTVHEYIVLAPEPLLGRAEEHTSDLSTNSEGYDTGIHPSAGDSLARLDLTGPGEPLPEAETDLEERLRRT